VNPEPIENKGKVELPGFNRRNYRKRCLELNGSLRPPEIGSKKSRKVTTKPTFTTQGGQSRFNKVKALTLDL